MMTVSRNKTQVVLAVEGGRAPPEESRERFFKRSVGNTNDPIGGKQK